MAKFTAFLTVSLLFSLIIHANTLERAPDQIIEIFRHGARAPLHDYDPNWAPSEYGTLTPVGMRQHYVLGKLLANKYANILGAPYDPTQVYVLSDITPRCIQSAVSQLNGIYEGTGPELKSGYPSSLAIPPYKDGRVGEIASGVKGVEALPNHNIAPIVNIIEEKDTYIFKNNGPGCPNGAIWEKENVHAEKAEEGLDIFHETIKKINKKADGAFKIKKLKELKSFCETMMADLADNRPLPYGIGKDKALVHNITYAYGYAAYQIWGGQKQQIQLYSFGLIDAILKQMEAFKKGEKYYKAVLYSGHDSNLFSILAAFGVLDTSCLLENFYASLKGEELPFQNCTYPYFASNLIVEFYNATKSDESASVKVIYNGQVLRLCNGQDMCSHEEFVVFARNATGNMTLESYPVKCGVNNASDATVNQTIPDTNNSQNHTANNATGNQTIPDSNNSQNHTANNATGNQTIPDTNNSQNNPAPDTSKTEIVQPGPQNPETWGKNAVILVLVVLCFVLVVDKINTRRKLGRAFRGAYKFNEDCTQMNYTNL